jgi:hypothetical protein
VFFERMDALIPWCALEAEIAPFYPSGGKGRQPYPLRAMTCLISSDHRSVEDGPL